MTVIGEVTSEQLDVIPMQVYVQVHHRPTYSCSKCDESIQTAPLPTQPIPKSYASPGLLAVDQHRFVWPLQHEDEVIALTGDQLNWLIGGYDIFRFAPHEALKFDAIT